MAEITKEQVDKFIEYFYKDEKGGIDLPSFMRIFENYEKKIEMEENPGYVHNQRRRERVERRILETKKTVFMEVNNALKQNRVSLNTLFKKIDSDNSSEISLGEFKNMFKQMHVHVTDQEADLIFASIDIDQDRAIQWAEFKLDFDKCIIKSVDELEADERLLHQDNDGPSYGMNSSSGPQGMKYDANAEIANAMKFADADRRI